MRNKAGLIARIFGRSQNTVVSKLYTHALGQPLLIHPAMGERLLGAYLDGAVDVPETVVESAGAIAVINVSGGLVNRPMPDICGPGPTSYAAIRNAFDAALADGNVSAIVLRMDSCGGMASGCFDLTDHIYASRGTKKIVAQIDDMAYSAAYAIAAACDSVQVTRTGGGGSVGAFTYHVDYSGANAKAGIAVDYIFAGDKKVDGNPDSPLGTQARADMQASIDKLYSIFTQSIAKYRAMAVADVVATQAGCYNGGDLLLVGFADTVGTLDDLLATLSKPEAEAPVGAEADNDDGDTEMPEALPNSEPGQPVIVADPAAALTAANDQIAKLETRKAFTDAVASAKLPAAVMQTLLDPKIADTITAEQIQPRIEHAQKVMDLCVAAKLETCAADFVSSNASLEQVRTQLSAAVADQGTEIVTTIPAKSNAANKSLDPTAIYATHNTRSKAK